MSDVNCFFDVSQGSSKRGTPYTVQPSFEGSSHAGWSRTRADVLPCTIKQPLKLAVNTGTYEDQIRAVLTNYHRFIGNTPSRASLKSRVQLLSSFYRVLKTSGYDIEDVTKFSLRHAKALLIIWNVRGCAPNTLYVRWSVIRNWTRTLSKHGMVGPLTDYVSGFTRNAETVQGYRVFSDDEVAARSIFLHTKSDLTHYLVDRITREMKVTREVAFEFEIDAVQTVLSGGTSLRVGMGSQQKHIPHARDHLELLVEARDFMLARNRKTLAWTGFDLDAAIQKYALRMAYVNRTIFPTATVATTQQKEGGAA